MDILTHTLSGIAVGTVISTYSSGSFIQKLKIVLLSGFAGALPDIDAISHWSGFDSTIGALFNLPDTGRDIYSAKYWYSHHAFMHSLFASLLFAGLIGLVAHILQKKSKRNWKTTFHQNRLLLLGFILGFSIHLLEDMPTPAASWGGVNFFWPSSSYIGGTGDIWWWNNYDIFLIVVIVIFLNLSLAGVYRIWKFNLRKSTTLVFLLGFSAALFQIKTREFDFAYSGSTSRYQEFEVKSKEIQKELLGDDLFELMEKLDNSLSIYF